MIPSFLSKYNILLLFFDKCSYLPQPCKAQLPGTAAGKPAAWGGGGVLQARGLWPRACKTKGAGACHLAGPRPFVRALRARRPPTCRRSPAHPYRKAALTRPLPRCARVLVGRLRWTGGRRGARSAPAGRGPKAPGRPVWRPEAAKRRRPPRQRWIPHCRQVVMPPSFSCGTNPPPNR